MFFRILVLMSISACLSHSTAHAENQTNCDEMLSFPFPATGHVVGKISGVFPASALATEPMLFASDFDFAMHHGGPITQYVLTELLKQPYVQKAVEGKIPGHTIIIDTRVHRLEVGEEPAIPGWHTDFAERTEASHFQPDYTRITPTVKTYVINISDHEGGVSNTEYMTEPTTLQLPKKGVYQAVDRQLNEDKITARAKLVDGEIIEMDQLSLHRGTPSHQAGQRYFMRFAILHDLPSTILQTAPQNEVRNQVQSYRSIRQELVHLGVTTVTPKRIYDDALFFHPETQMIALPGLKSHYSVNEIKAETILEDADIAFALEHGGPITQQVLKEVLSKFPNGKFTVNTRIHMMMPGQLADIPIWRSGAPFSEVVYQGKKGTNFVAAFSSQETGIAPIEFLKDDNTAFALPEGQIALYDNGTLSRATRARTGGWKLSIVVSTEDHPAENKITQQVRAFLEDLSLGW